MATKEAIRRLPLRLYARPRANVQNLHTTSQRSPCRTASTAASDLSELDAQSSFETVPPQDGSVSNWDPLALSRSRKNQLPPSRYQYRSPRYYRGPYHPHQPPPASDPASREFRAGPFSLPGLQQTYESTIAPDLMAMTYQHFPPGYEAPARESRLRPWVGESPYFEGRPTRGPRGGDSLRLRRKPITFRNIPSITKVTVHSMVKGAVEDSKHLHVAGMVLQAITGVRCTAHASTHNVVQWGLRAGKYVSVTAAMEGENMYHFLSKLVDVVLPRIRDWRGVSVKAGDRSGNITFGLPPDALQFFPEILVNYDSYPPKLIPGCHITIQTSARTDPDARLLLSAIGIPFDGKLTN